MKKLRVTVEGKVYEVLVELLDETSHAAPSPSPSLPAVTAASVSAPAPAAPAPAPAPRAGSQEPGVVPSPLAGKVVSVDVKVGDTVAAGAQVAVLEAMKMNTYINAPRAGKIEAILIKPGDAVEEGSPLLRIA